MHPRKVEGATSFGESGYHLLKKGYEYYENGSIDEAKNYWGDANQAFDKAIESDQSNASYWNGKGCALIDIGGIEKQEEAARDFDVATALDPENAMYWDHKGWALSSVGEPDEAFKAFDKAIELDPQNAFIYWAHKGDALMLVDRRDEALKAYAQYDATAGGIDIMELSKRYPAWPLIQ
jgi:tetratricopeptide (TPR) repeat protein